MYVCVFVLK